MLKVSLLNSFLRLTLDVGNYSWIKSFVQQKIISVIFPAQQKLNPFVLSHNGGFFTTLRHTVDV